MNYILSAHHDGAEAAPSLPAGEGFSSNPFQTLPFLGQQCQGHDGQFIAPARTVKLAHGAVSVSDSGAHPVVIFQAQGSASEALEAELARYTRLGGGYIFSGHDPATGRPWVRIGDSQDLRRRLEEHRKRGNLNPRTITAITSKEGRLANATVIMSWLEQMAEVNPDVDLIAGAATPCPALSHADEMLARIHLQQLLSLMDFGTKSLFSVHSKSQAFSKSQHDQEAPHSDQPEASSLNGNKECYAKGKDAAQTDSIAKASTAQGRAVGEARAPHQAAEALNLQLLFERALTVEPFTCNLPELDVIGIKVTLGGGYTRFVILPGSELRSSVAPYAPKKTRRFRQRLVNNNHLLALSDEKLELKRPVMLTTMSSAGWFIAGNRANGVIDLGEPLAANI